MMWITVIFIAEIIVCLFMLLFGRKRNGGFFRENPYPFQIKWLLPASYLIVDQLQLMEKFPDFTAKVHHKLLTLYGRSFASHGSKMFFAELISASTACVLIFTLLSALAGGDGTIVGFGMIASLLVPMLMVRDLDTKIRKKQQHMILELPEVLNTIVLLVNAGETVNRAWIRCVEARKHKGQTPLFKELAQAVHELEMNASFTKVMEDFSKRCALHEVSLFTSTLLLNYKRGGSDFVVALQALSLELWQRRKSVSRILGEEASSKLVFPMVLIFVVVMVIVAAPALLMMKQ
ncbi:type II secretion system F family protein [Paenibacillus sedimenti]|uniref:Type II secretion system F family protein n=1 Tax=Paenibacillus sedimenti TaxID=2770274 RepID=A0A926KKC4_9BACL|nr:type II secretion system F family protein [Paenibacillus sedimenti]MBD0379382.1 type II secretion system F family protein [Paenibacillus sedimenti]